MSRTPFEGGGTASGDTVALSPDFAAAIAQQFGGGEEKNELDIAEKGPCEILRIVPDGRDARIAFHELAQKKMEQALDAHHAQFIHVQGRAHLSSGEGHDDSGSSSNEETTIYQGYYRVDFESLPWQSAANWVLGKGVRNASIGVQNVDILLAAPDSKSRRHIASVHAILRIHPASGAWTIRTGPLCKAEKHKPSGEALKYTDPYGISECNHEVVYLNGMAMKHGAFRALTSPRTSLVLGGLHFSIEFRIDSTEKEKAYTATRQIFYRALEVPGPAPEVSGIPFTSDIKTTFAVFRRGLGRGAFGTVHDGYEPITGEPRAVKKLPYKDVSQKAMIRQEISLQQQFDGNEGIVRMHGWCNAFNEQDLNVEPPFDVYLFFEKGISFHDHPWPEDGSCWKQRKVLCKQLLAGLSVIHANGCMHRDITPMNILYFSQEPSHAALCDFGKMCKRMSDIETRLAAWRWLPPEIRENEANLYDQKIDIWMLGLSLICSWFPISYPHTQLRTRVTYSNLTDILRVETARKPNDRADLASFFLKLIEYDPQARPSAEEAFDDSCLAGVSDEDLRYLRDPSAALGLKRPRDTA